MTDSFNPYHVLQINKTWLDEIAKDQITEENKEDKKSELIKAAYQLNAELLKKQLAEAEEILKKSDITEENSKQQEENINNINTELNALKSAYDILIDSGKRHDCDQELSGKLDKKLDEITQQTTQQLKDDSLSNIPTTLSEIFNIGKNIFASLKKLIDSSAEKDKLIENFYNPFDTARKAAVFNQIEKVGQSDGATIAVNNALPTIPTVKVGAATTTNSPDVEAKLAATATLIMNAMKSHEAESAKPQDEKGTNHAPPLSPKGTAATRNSGINSLAENFPVTQTEKVISSAKRNNLVLQDENGSELGERSSSRRKLGSH